MQVQTSTRIEVDVMDTSLLLGTILQNFRIGNFRVSFLTEPAQGVPTLARIRTRLSRVRKGMTQKNKPHEKFLIQSWVIPWTDRTGKRWECVIVEKKKTEKHKLQERFEDSMGLQL